MSRINDRLRGKHCGAGWGLDAGQTLRITPPVAPHRGSSPSQKALWLRFPKHHGGCPVRGILDALRIGPTSWTGPLGRGGCQGAVI